jgi:hypothetical protein
MFNSFSFLTLSNQSISSMREIVQMLRNSIFSKLFYMFVGAALLAAVAGGGGMAITHAQGGGGMITLSPGNGATVIGMPYHAPETCTDYNVPGSHQHDQAAQFAVLPHTEILSVSNNWTRSWVASRETNTGVSVIVANGVATVTYTGTIDGGYGLSGNLRVCFGPSPDAPLFGKIGLGTAPAGGVSTVSFVDGAGYSVTADVVHGETHQRFGFFISVGAANNSFALTPIVGTKLTAEIPFTHNGAVVNIPVGIVCAQGASVVCSFTLPENDTFGDFAGEPNVLVWAEWDKNNVPVEPNTIGIVVK